MKRPCCITSHALRSALRTADTESSGADTPAMYDVQRKSGEHSDGEGTSAKKARVVWSVEMHQQFVNAVNTLGVDSES